MEGIFEKIVYKYAVDFFDDNNIFYQYQFGFRNIILQAMP